MCGIVGLFCKSPELEPRLGDYLAAMLEQMSDRGPDSAGVAVYRDPAPSGSSKLTLYSFDTEMSWGALSAELAVTFGGAHEAGVRANHAVFIVEGEAAEVEDWIRRHRPDVRVMSAGRVIEIYKEVGRPQVFVQQFHLGDIEGSHGLGHTRMATESRVTTEGSHPFSTGLDLCLVHNGSLSNHNDLRRWLRKEGIRFGTDNDSEVAARYIARRMASGEDLGDALRMVLKEFDGFFTLLVSTHDQFAVVRDAFACKPAVIAEAPGYVAMASEYHALAGLPGIEEADVFEPMPEEIHLWSR